MKKRIAFGFLMVCMLSLIRCGKQPNISEQSKAPLMYDKRQEPSHAEETAIETSRTYTYEELSEMPAKKLLDVFVQNGLVINDAWKGTYTEEELQTLFREHFDLWHMGLSAFSHTMYHDLAEQTKAIYDKLVE